MKRRLLFRAYCALLSMGIVSGAQAKDIYVSASGNDMNDGSTTALAVKTVSKAISIAEDNDVIYIKGFISLLDEPAGPGDPGENGGTYAAPNGVTYSTWNARGGTTGVQMLKRSLTFVGDETVESGFDGEGESRLFMIRELKEKTLKFQHLTFKNGTNDMPGTRDDNQGAGVYLRSTYATFEYCKFTNNISAGSNKEGGAVYAQANSDDAGLMANPDGRTRFSNCEFTNNVCQNGGALFFGYNNLLIENCVFEKNGNFNDVVTTPLLDSRGGAILIKRNGGDNYPINLKVVNTIFKENKLSGRSGTGGAFHYRDELENTTPATSSLWFERCAFIENEAFGADGTCQGGAIFFNHEKAGSNNPMTLTMVNTTMYGNVAKQGGGAIFVRRAGSNSIMNFVNCTIAGNVGGDNAGFGHGIYFSEDSNADFQNVSTKNMKAYIYNTIMEDNRGTNDIAPSDLRLNYNPEANLTIENSFIGKVMATTFAPEAYTTSKLNYDETDKVNNPGFEFVSNLVDPFFTLDEFFCVPLEFGLYGETASEGIGFGNASYLQALEINTDQLNNIRPFTDGKCNIGAVEVDEDQLDFDPGYPSSLAETVSAKELKAYFYDGSLVIESNKTEDALVRIEIFNISGALTQVNSVTVSSGKQYIPLSSLAKGIYIVKISDGKNAYATKIVI